MKVQSIDTGDDIPVRLGKYMVAHVTVRAEGRKTDTWEIYNVNSGVAIGHVRWYGRWRCYSFFPEPDTVFNSECLSELCAFCKAKTMEHRGK